MGLMEQIHHNFANFFHTIECSMIVLFLIPNFKNTEEYLIFGTNLWLKEQSVLKFTNSTRTI